MLAAATLSIEGTLVSADEAFAGIRRLRHVVPDAGGVDALLDA